MVLSVRQSFTVSTEGAVMLPKRPRAALTSSCADPGRHALLQTDVLRFEPAFLGKVHLAIALASLIGACLCMHMCVCAHMVHMYIWFHMCRI